MTEIQINLLILFLTFMVQKALRDSMQHDNLNEKPYDQFLRENFGFNCDRFNRLLKDSTMLTPDEIEKVIIYLER